MRIIFLSLAILLGYSVQGQAETLEFEDRKSVV